VRLRLPFVFRSFTFPVYVYVRCYVTFVRLRFTVPVVGYVHVRLLRLFTFDVRCVRLICSLLRCVPFVRYVVPHVYIHIYVPFVPARSFTRFPVRWFWRCSLLVGYLFVDSCPVVVYSVPHLRVVYTFYVVPVPVCCCCYCFVFAFCSLGWLFVLLVCVIRFTFAFVVLLHFVVGYCRCSVPFIPCVHTLPVVVYSPFTLIWLLRCVYVGYVYGFTLLPALVRLPFALRFTFLHSTPPHVRSFTLCVGSLPGCYRYLRSVGLPHVTSLFTSLLFGCTFVCVSHVWFYVRDFHVVDCYVDLLFVALRLSLRLVPFTLILVVTLRYILSVVDCCYVVRSFVVVVCCSVVCCLFPVALLFAILIVDSFFTFRCCLIRSLFPLVVVRCVRSFVRCSVVVVRSHLLRYLRSLLLRYVRLDYS
jgi:hypothetical protein